MTGWLLVKDQNLIFDWLRFDGRSRRHHTLPLYGQVIVFAGLPALLETGLWIQGLLRLRHYSPEVPVPRVS